MKTKVLLRIAAVCVLFFATGHCVGHFTRHSVTDPKARELLHLMSVNKFDMFGQLRSYDENYTGMSLNLIFTLLALAALLWILSAQTEKQPLLVKKLLVPITICVFAFGITSFLYFFPVPALSCLLAVVFTTWAIIKL